MKTKLVFVERFQEGKNRRSKRYRRLAYSLNFQLRGGSLLLVVI